MTIRDKIPKWRLGTDQWRIVNGNVAIDGQPSQKSDQESVSLECRRVGIDTSALIVMRDKQRKMAEGQSEPEVLWGNIETK
jgi:hypothetical protein